MVRYRRATGLERQQIKWFALGLALTLAALLIPILLLLPRPLEDSLLSGIFLSVGFLAIPATTGVAILRYRLFDVDRIIGHATVYGLLTAGVVGVYVFVVGYLGLLFRTSDNLLVSLVAVGLVALLFQPVRDRLQRVVNRLMYGERDDPHRVLARLGRQLEAAAAPDEVLDTVASSVRTALKLPYVALTVQRGEMTHVVAESGSPVTSLNRIPLIHQGVDVGELLVAPREPSETWSRADRALLDSLGHQAGAAIHALQLTRELQLARERLVLAREEERRRLRHDLHDELAPTLAALSLTSARASDRLTKTRQVRATCSTSCAMVYGRASATCDGWRTTCGRRYWTSSVCWLPSRSAPSSSAPIRA